METIKVNMNPNPLDVQTIHASQNDGEARQWEFELHNNGELIDTSDITEQLFFKAYKGGTEQILPENTSTPTTSPFLGDIKYPQGLLTDQEFTYRQSPTEEDGNAKIKNLYGNTLVWNQILKNGNFENTSLWGSVRGTIAVSNNILSYTSSQIGGGSVQNRITRNDSFAGGHKYLLSVECKPAHATTLTVQFRQGTDIYKLTDVSAVWSRNAFIFEPTNAVTEIFIGLAETASNGYVVGDVDQYRNIQVFDLTQMGLDSLTAEQFTSLFSKPYYDYNQGTLIPFSGNGIKTTGKNLLSYSGENLPYNANGVSITRENNIYRIVASDPSGYPFARINTIHYLPKGQYTITMLGAESSNAGIAWRLIDRNVSPVKIFANASTETTIFMLNEDVHDVYFEITIDTTKLTAGTWDVRFQLNLGLPSEYEPYTSSTLSLPISTYFPTGMKSAGNVYDELTEDKAITRIGAVDLGTLNYDYNAVNIRFQAPMPSNYKIPASAKEREQLLCAKYDTNSNPLQVGGDNGITGYQNSYNIFIRDNAYTDPNTFKASLSGVYLYYELATPLENYGVVDLGTLNWAYSSDAGHLRFYTEAINDSKKPLSGTILANIICNKYQTVTESQVFGNTNIGICLTSTGRVMVYDPSYSSAEAFKQAMQGVYLLYEKENPQGFTTASLVTENAEIPLSNNDGVLIGKCTEQLSENPGFIDAKIKLSDSDGECYSNKLQLHVERSPQ